MPTKPQVKQNLTQSSEKILQAVYDNGSELFQSVVPRLSGNQDIQELRDFGKAILDYPTKQLQNELMMSLWGAVAQTWITSKLYSNPWAMFKKGIVELGEAINEIFVEMAKPHMYNPKQSQRTVFDLDMPELESVFHVMNYQYFYKKSIFDKDLKLCFLSWNGVTDLIAKIVDSLYNGAAYDEYCVMKYMIALRAISGDFYAEQIPTVAKENVEDITADITAVSYDMTFEKTKYNPSGVKTFCPIKDQINIVNTKFQAVLGVTVLSKAFNIDYVEFSAKTVLVDGFGDIDWKRLDELFGVGNYVKFTDEEIATLNSVPAMVVDKDFFMIFDNLLEFTENYNGEGLYWNYFYHTWKTFSSSPFVNRALFVPNEPSIESLTVTPTSATVLPGQSLQLSVDVVSNYFASKSVSYAISTDAPATVSVSGLVTVDYYATAGTQFTVTVKSIYDTSKSQSVTITVGGGTSQT